jgi:hypothetical protein
MSPLKKVASGHNTYHKVPNEASCAWEPNLINFPILGKKMVKIEKLGNQKA